MDPYNNTFGSYDNEVLLMQLAGMQSTNT